MSRSRSRRPHRLQASRLAGKGGPERVAGVGLTTTCEWLATDDGVRSRGCDRPRTLSRSAATSTWSFRVNTCGSAHANATRRSGVIVRGRPLATRAAATLGLRSLAVVDPPNHHRREAGRLRGCRHGDHRERARHPALGERRHAQLRAPFRSARKPPRPRSSAARASWPGSPSPRPATRCPAGGHVLGRPGLHGRQRHDRRGGWSTTPPPGARLRTRSWSPMPAPPSRRRPGPQPAVTEPCAGSAPDDDGRINIQVPTSAKPASVGPQDPGLRSTSNGSG